MHVYLNSRLLAAEAAMVSVFDRGFAYGDSLIETLKILEGRPVFFNEHFQRLRNSMELAGFDNPLDPSGLRNQAVSLAEENDVKVGRLRIQLSRGLPASPTGGIDPEPGMQSTLLVTAEPLSGYPEEIYRDGIACQTVAAGRGSLARLKNASLLQTVNARREAHAAGAREAVFTSGHGRLLEGSTSNTFFAIGGRFVTAGEDQQILPGITRGKVIGIAEEIGLEIRYEAPKLGDLRSGEDAAFITASIVGVCPVSTIDGKELRLETGLTGRLNKRLAELELADIANAD